MYVKIKFIENKIKKKHFFCFVQANTIYAFGYSLGLLNSSGRLSS